MLVPAKRESSTVQHPAKDAAIAALFQFASSPLHATLVTK